jgi:hypothetical protein
MRRWNGRERSAARPASTHGVTPRRTRLALVAGVVALVGAGAFVGSRLRQVPVLVEARVRISASGSCSIAQNAFDCAHLGSQLATAHAVPGCRILLDPDPNAPLEAIQVALASARASGYRQVQFAPRAPRPGKL